jgi:hypothetical protein
MPDPEPTPDPTPEPTPPVDPPAPDPAPDPALGPAGEAALKAERKRAADAEKAAKALQKKLDDIEASNLSEQERAVAAARNEGASEATTKANERIIKTEIRAAAAGKLQDPADALAHIDPTQFAVGDDGEVDTAAITSAIDELLTTKPYLGTGATPAPAVPGVPKGARPSGDAAPQLTAADLKTMTPEQIVEAKAKGQFDTILGST